MSDHKGHTLFRQSSLLLVSLVISGIFTLLVSVTIARFLGPSEYGVYALIFSIQTIVGIFAFFNLGPAMAKYIAESSAYGDPRQMWISKIGLSIIAVASVASAVIYVLLSYPLGFWLYGDLAITSLIPFSALVVISAAFQGAVFGIVQGMKRLRYMMWMQISVPAINLGFIIALIPELGIAGAFIASSAAQAIVAISMLIGLSRKGFRVLTPVPPEFRSDILRKLVNFSLPYTLSSVIVTPMYWLGNTELEFIAGFAAIGLFAVANTMHNMFLVLPYSVLQLLFPKISELSVRSMELVRSTVVNIVHSATILFFPIFLAAALFSRNIIDILYGSSYEGASEIAYTMVALSFFISISGLIGSALLGLGRMWLSLRLDIVFFISFVLTLFLTVPNLGLFGLGLTFSCAWALRLMALIYITKRHLGISLIREYKIFLVSALIFIVDAYFMFTYPEMGWILSLLLLLIGISIMALLGRKVYASFMHRVMSKVRMPNKLD